MQVNPNPAIGQIRIATGLNLPTEVQISNLTAKVIWNGMVRGTEIIDENFLPKGVYLVSAGNSINQKLVVQ